MTQGVAKSLTRSADSSIERDILQFDMRLTPRIQQEQIQSFHVFERYLESANGQFCWFAQREP